MTNGDRIRQMSNEELAQELVGNCKFCMNYMIACMGDNKSKCLEGIKAYLESEEE